MAARHKSTSKSGSGKGSATASGPSRPAPATLSHASATDYLRRRKSERIVEDDYAAKLLAMKGSVPDDVEL